MAQLKRWGARLFRIGSACVLLVGTAAAAWIDPPPTDQADQAAALRAKPPQSLAAIELAPRTGVESPMSAANAGLQVAQWRFGGNPASSAGQSSQINIAPGRPLYLWLTLDGTQAAVDSMRSRQRLVIQVHWVRDSAGTGAPNLVTDLAIGHPGLADTLAQQVRRKGFFEWHSWAEKGALSPGVWTVSLTYPDGQPLPCGPDAQPCRFKINIG